MGQHTYPGFRVAQVPHSKPNTPKGNAPLHNPTRRNEMRLSMSLFTWALDLCVINAYALLNEVRPAATKIPLREFKIRIAEQLTAKQLAITSAQRSKRKRADVNVSDVVRSITSNHVLTQFDCTLRRAAEMQIVQYPWFATAVSLGGVSDASVGSMLNVLPLIIFEMSSLPPQCQVCAQHSTSCAPLQQRTMPSRHTTSRTSLLHP
jgi:hypothetical protein